MIAFARRIVLVLLVIIASILISGGGRITPVDFMDIGAWAAPAAFSALLLYFLGHDPFYVGFRKTVTAIARHPYWIVGVAFLIIALAHLARMATFKVNICDAGFLYQPILHAFRWPPLACDICYLDSYLGMHQAFTLPILYPIAALAGSPLIFPVLAAALGWAVFIVLGRAFRDELDPLELSFVFFSLLCIRGFREGFLFDLREDLLGAVFFAFGLFLVKRGRLFLAVIPCALATLSKETAVFLIQFAAFAVLFETGAFSRWRERRNLTAIAVYALLTTVLFVFIFLISLPTWSSSAGKGSEFAIRLAFLGNEPSAIVHQLFFHPLGSAVLLFQNILTWDRFRYLLFIVFPFTPFLIAGWNFYYLPGLVLVLGNLVSLPATQRMMQFHYDLFALPFFAFGLAESLVQMKKRGKPKAGFLAVWAVIFLSVSGVWPMTHLREYLADASRISDYFWARNEVNSVSSETPVLADSWTYPVFVDREHLRYLEKSPFNPEAQNVASTVKIGDSRIAFLLKAVGDRAFSPEWRLVSCGPRNFVCRYER